MFRSLMFVAVISFVGTLIVIPGVAYSFNNAEHFCKSPLTKAIPSRAHDAIDASSFVARVNESNGKQREILILDQIMAGNIPEFLRHLHSVTYRNVRRC